MDVVDNCRESEDLAPEVVVRKPALWVKATQVSEHPPLAIAPFDAETARRHQEAWAEFLGTQVEITNSIGMKLVLVPPGEFLMGTPGTDAENGTMNGERPQHRVRISKPFFLGVFPVTQIEYRRVMGSDSNPSQWCGATLPVHCVSWEQAHEFCRRLSAFPAESRYWYRLPTEAEWE